MSGIAAILNQQGSIVDEQLIIAMAALMTRRGPEYQQYWADGNIAMAHTLLSTTVESVNENQPSTLDGKVWLSADIRIDARDELIGKIKTREANISASTTDDKLLLHAYQIWGVDCLEHIIGDFAFILWDSSNQRLFCATDHFGVAPLYYASTSQGLCVSNTLNAIRLHPGISTELDELAIADYLLFRINENSKGTFFEHIQHLPAGHCLIHEGNKTQLKKYWSYEPNGELHHTTPDSYIEEFSDLLNRAVADRTRTNSVGVHLSGGMDSSSVTAITHALMNERRIPQKITAYTYGASGTLADLESPFASEIATQLGIEHHTFVDDSLALESPSAPKELGSPEPRFTTRETTNYKLLEHVSTHSTVLLTGFGGDPLLRGRSLTLNDANTPKKVASLLKCYQLHRQFFGKRPSLGLRKAPRKNISSRNIPSWVNFDFAEKHDLLERYHSILSMKTEPNSAQLSMTNGGLWRRIFCWNDPGFTHVPVKVLHPFFDTRLLNFSKKLPPFPWLHDKTILRQSMRPHLPESVIQRPKTPLPGNGLQSTLLSQTVPDRYKELLNNTRLNAYVDTTHLKSVLADPSSAARADFKSMMRVVTLSDWLIDYEVKPTTKTLEMEHQNIKRIRR